MRRSMCNSARPPQAQWMKEELQGRQVRSGWLVTVRQQSKCCRTPIDEGRLMQGWPTEEKLVTKTWRRTSRIVIVVSKNSRRRMEKEIKIDWGLRSWMANEGKLYALYMLPSNLTIGFPLCWNASLWLWFLGSFGGFDCTVDTSNRYGYY